VWRAGGAYLPLDPDLPAERLAFLLADSGAAVLLGHDHRLSQVRAAAPAAPRRVIALDGPGAADVAPVPVDPAAHPDGLAYVVYTSGSTGRPKGVALTHRGLANVVAWRQRTFRLGPDDRVAQKTPLGADVATGEIFWPLAAGAQVVIVEGRAGDVEQLAEAVRDQAITVIDCVPSLLHHLVRRPEFTSATALRLVICGGEALPADDVALLHASTPGVVVQNVYGPTEASIDVSSHRCRPPAELPPIGRPIDNTRLYVLDPALNPVPRGAVGEMYIAALLPTIEPSAGAR